MLVKPMDRMQRAVHAGDLVVAAHPLKSIEICKRAASVGADGSVELLSDNPDAGQDSRHFGPVASSSIRGVVSFVLARPS